MSQDYSTCDYLFDGFNILHVLRYQQKCCIPVVSSLKLSPSETNLGVYYFKKFFTIPRKHCIPFTPALCHNSTLASAALSSEGKLLGINHD